MSLSEPTITSACIQHDTNQNLATQGLAIVMTKEGEEKEVLEMLQRAVNAALKADKAKEATNLRMLLGQMLTLQVSFLHANKYRISFQAVSFSATQIYCSMIWVNHYIFNVNLDEAGVCIADPSRCTILSNIPFHTRCKCTLLLEALFFAYNYLFSAFCAHGTKFNGEFKEFMCWLNCMLLWMGLQGNLEAALEQYKDVIKDDPRDFRPYLCQVCCQGSLA